MRSCHNRNPSIIFAYLFVFEWSSQIVQSNSNVLNIDPCDKLMATNDVEAENDPPAFTIMTGTQTLDACNRLNVTLKATEEDTFSNVFILQARSENTHKAVGMFSMVSESAIEFINCGGGPPNTVRYEAPAYIEDVYLEWFLDSEFSGNIYFVAAIKSNRTTTWSNITSQLVAVSNKGQDCFMQDIAGTLTSLVGGLPGNFCNSTNFCFEGLECRDSKCACPLPCVYVANISSCDCGPPSPEYGGPVIVGIIAGSIIIALWYWIIKQTIANYKTNKGRVYNNGNPQRPPPSPQMQHLDEYNLYMQNNTNYRTPNHRVNYVNNPNYDYQPRNYNNQQSYPNVPYSTNFQNHPNSIYNPPYPTYQNTPYQTNPQNNPINNNQNYTGIQGPSIIDTNSSNFGTNPNNLPIDNGNVAITSGTPEANPGSRPRSTETMLTSHSSTSNGYPSQNLAVAPLEPLKPLAPLNEGLSKHNYKHFDVLG